MKDRKGEGNIAEYDPRAQFKWVGGGRGCQGKEKERKSRMKLKKEVTGTKQYKSTNKKKETQRTGVEDVIQNQKG